MPRDTHSSWWRALPLAIAAPALAPIYGVAHAVSAWRRARLASDAGARAALARLGVHAPVADALDPQLLGGGHANAVVSVSVRGRRRVLKQALPVGSVLGFCAGRVGPMPYASDVGGAARVRRELAALIQLRVAGIRVPRVIAADIDAGLLLLEHVDGSPLTAAAGDPQWLAQVAAFGRAVAAAHRAGVAVTDSHPGNALLTRSGAVALLDLEFAELRDDLGDAFPRRCAFDVAYAASFFEGDEQRVFLAAAGGANVVDREVDAERDRLRAFAPLFAAERRRQRARALQVAT